MRTDLSSKIKHDLMSKLEVRPGSELELASLTRYEKMVTKIAKTSAEGAAVVALEIAEYIDKCVQEKGRCVMALGTGMAALDVYEELVKLYFADKVSFQNVIVFNLNELGLGGRSNKGQSTFVRLESHLLKKVDIAPENVHTIDRETARENVDKMCRQYETLIDEYGGLDLVLCQLTKGGGLAFNDTGSASTSACRLVLLSNETRQCIADSYQCKDAPDAAVTLGISNIRAARKVLCVAWGEDCAVAVREAVEGKITELYPASFLQMHPDVKLVIDLEASSQLTRINMPWKVSTCDWTDQLVRRAIVWLCRQTEKPILKLTNKDYNANGLSELITVFGSGYDVNIKTFNDLQHTITGWPGGKPNADDTYRPERATPYPKRVIVFSPHPDDAIVSMGGTIRRLVQQGHDVHVAFMASGDVAVADEDLARTIMLNDKISEHFGYQSELRTQIARNIIKGLDEKRVGTPDNADMRYLKGQILVCEGIMSCKFMGVSVEHIHELSMPFYQDHPFGMGKISDADTLPLKKLIEEIHPHQIFFAADHGDPYGTHERCINALIATFDKIKDEEWMRACRIWMYGGQWGAWGIDHIEMAVPMSPEEFSVKRTAILKYESQIHDAPFRDPEDGQLSWQRSIERNKSTADIYARLGLASYEAMEVFVQYKL